MAADDDLAHGSTVASDTLEETQASNTTMAAALGPGTQVGKFELAERLGAGAMGVVYAAHDPELDRRVAIKLIKTRAQADGLHARLYREAQALARVAHPNVVVVHEVGEHAGQVFVAMELVKGVTLRAWLAAKPRTLAEILRVLVQAGRGLAAAHAADLVHRDFKPDNVLIGEDGRARVTDFGLARTQGETIDDGERTGSPLDVQLTQTGALVGTPIYASPEQLAGERVGAASDQFSFCITAWEALYGKRPFAATEFADLLLQVTTGDLTDPPAGKRVPRQIHRALERGLAPDPAARWPSMDALLGQLTLRQRRIRGIAIAAGVSVAAGLGIGVAMSSREPAELSCADESRALDHVWNADMSRALQAHLVATGVPLANDIYTDVAHKLDRYAQRWSAKRLEVCPAARDGDAASARLLLCLDQRMTNFEASIEQSFSYPKTVAANFTVLEPLDSCGKGVRPITAIRGDIIHAQVQWFSGDNDGGTKALDALQTRSEALAYPPIVAEVLIAKAAIAAVTRDYAGAATLLRRSEAIADRAGDDRTKVLASTMLVRMLLQFDQVEEAEHELQIAEDTFARLGPDVMCEARIKLARGALALARNHAAEAIPSLERAVAITSAIDYKTDDAGDRLTEAYTKVGRTADADKLRPQVAQLDPWNTDPHLATVTANVKLLKDCEAVIHAEPERTIAVCQRAADKLEGADAMALGVTLLAIGSAHELREERPAAREVYLRQVAVYEKANNQQQLVVALQSAARQALELGDATAAAAEYKRSAELSQKLGKPGEHEYADSRIGLGRAYVAGGHFADGITELEWAIPRLEVAETARIVLASARLSLADGTWQRNGAGDRARARRIAMIARDDIHAYRETLTNTAETLTPYYIKRSDLIAKRIDTWLASHKL